MHFTESIKIVIMVLLGIFIFMYIICIYKYNIYSEIFLNGRGCET